MISYTISQPETYGCAGAYGNKYWVRVGEKSPEVDIEKLLTYLLRTCKKEKVVFTGHIIMPKPMMITFFVYTDLEKEEGVDGADLIYEWEEKEGLVRTKGGE